MRGRWFTGSAGAAVRRTARGASIISTPYPRAMLRLAVFIVCVAIAGCTGGGTGPAPLPPFDPGSGMGPFAPAQMRIYPLSCFELGPLKQGTPDSAARIICHLEFTDRWYDTTKAVGVVQVRLYRVGSGSDRYDARWDVDLSDLNLNAEWFDPVTRTYRVQLNLPAWVRADLGPTCRLLVTFVPANKESSSRDLTDETILRTDGPGTPMPDSMGFPTSAEFPHRTSQPESAKPVEPEANPAAPPK